MALKGQVSEQPWPSPAGPSLSLLRRVSTLLGLRFQVRSCIPLPRAACIALCGVILPHRHPSLGPGAVQGPIRPFRWGREIQACESRALGRVLGDIGPYQARRLHWEGEKEHSWASELGLRSIPAFRSFQKLCCLVCPAVLQEMGLILESPLPPP